MLFRKNHRGVSLLMGMLFSLAILAAASMISSAMVHAGKNVRNIEDINIAFFSAEAGIEEALYYNSFHRKGWECYSSSGATENSCDPVNKKEISLGSDIIPNVYYECDVDGRVNSADIAADQGKGIGFIPFGKTATLNFSYDNRNKNETISVAKDVNVMPANLKVEFGIPKSFSGKLDTTEPNQPVMTWVASFVDDLTTTEKRLLFNYFKAPPGDGSDDSDCYKIISTGAPVVATIQENKGKILCRNPLYGSLYDQGTQTISSPISVSYEIKDSAFSGIPDGNKTLATKEIYKADGSGFFQNSGQSYRKLKFFFLQTIKGSTPSDPPLDKIYYKIDPQGNTISALNTTISSRGRSGNIMSELQVKINNTEEFSVLDYTALLE